jgi:SWI/SNF related-matrix-associated actin-dependent regulator of chromatin subfamily C
MGPPFTGHFRVSVDTPRGILPFAPSAPMIKAVAKSSKEKNAEPLPNNVGLSKSVYEEEKVKEEVEESSPEVNAKKWSCTTCGVDCTKSRYHCSKYASIDLCHMCYLDGRFPSSLFSGDFTRIESGNAESEDWTDSETLLLLEGIELYEEDWSKVSDHVGTKSRDECILKFLQLPIEDPYLRKSGNGEGVNGTVSDLGPLQYHRIPFSPSDNPILTLTSFLASIVPAKVASEAAKAAISQLENGKPENSNVLEKAATVALGSAAAKSHVLANNEEKELSKLTNTLIELELKKMKVKLSHFEELESLLELEKQSLSRERQQFYLDRLAFRKTVITASPVQLGNGLNEYVDLNGDFITDESMSDVKFESNQTDSLTRLE